MLVLLYTETRIHLPSDFDLLARSQCELLALRCKGGDQFRLVYLFAVLVMLLTSALERLARRLTIALCSIDHCGNSRLHSSDFDRNFLALSASLRQLSLFALNT